MVKELLICSHSKRQKYERENLQSSSLSAESLGTTKRKLTQIKTTRASVRKITSLTSLYHDRPHLSTLHPFFIPRGVHRILDGSIHAAADLNAQTDSRPTRTRWVQIVS